MNFPILSFITFLPILGMIIVLMLPKNRELLVKQITLAVTSLQLIAAVIILTGYNYALGGINNVESFQFVEKFRWIEMSGFSWIGTIKIDYFLGIDGLSVPMVLLTAIITFIATLASWNINKSVKGILRNVPSA
jgi:NADH-quinone oxidoreductase subunit M